MYVSYFDSPIGSIELHANDKGLMQAMFAEGEKKKAPKLMATSTNTILEQAQDELKAYFKGEVKKFNTPIAIEGSEFEMKVWQYLPNVAYGYTQSYLAMSEALGNAKAIRAVATANGRNKINIILPCHRIIGSNGALVGYAGDLWRKEWLLKHELRFSGKRANELF